MPYDARFGTKPMPAELARSGSEYILASYGMFTGLSLWIPLGIRTNINPRGYLVVVQVYSRYIGHATVISMVPFI